MSHFPTKRKLFAALGSGLCKTWIDGVAPTSFDELVAFFPKLYEFIAGHEAVVRWNLVAPKDEAIRPSTEERLPVLRAACTISRCTTSHGGRSSYSAIGGKGNVGSRVESLTKQYHVPIPLTESMRGAPRKWPLSRSIAPKEIQGLHGLCQERLVHVRENPPTKDWDGVFMASKK